MDADYQLYVINSVVKKFQKGKKWGDGMWKCGDSLKNVIHNMKYSSMKFDGNSKNIFLSFSFSIHLTNIRKPKVLCAQGI